MTTEVMRPESIVAYGSTIEAVIYGLADSGVSVITGYPGFHAQDIITGAGGSISVNERTAYSVAWGAAMAGTRAAVVLKNVGLNDAADPFINSMNLRTNAGFVVIVLDDVEVAGSQCRQDSRHYFDLAPGIWLEPMSASHAYDCVRNAAQWSEELEAPVVIRLTNESLRCTEKFVRSNSEELITPYRRDWVGSVSHPVNVAAQRIANEKRSRRINCFVERQFAFEFGGEHGRVAIGAAMPPSKLDCCHVWTYPMPGVKLRQQLRHAKSIDIHEAGTCFASETIRALFSTMSVETRDHSTQCDHSESYRTTDQFDPLFAAIRMIKDRIVVGDLGSFTMDRHRTVDACLCYGASVATSIGCNLGNPGYKTICVTGDAAFLHSGKAAMEEAASRESDITLVLIDNGGAVSTGGQSVPATVRFPGAASVTEVNHQSTSESSYWTCLHRLVDLPGVNVLHVRV